MSFDAFMSADDFVYLIQNENVTAIEDLIAVGFDPDRRLGGGVSFLMLAVGAGFPAAARALIEGGADVNHQDDKGNTPLMWVALNKGDRDCLSLLLEKGADSSLRNAEGKRAVDIAEEKGQTDTVMVLRTLRDAVDEAAEERAAAAEAAARAAALQNIKTLKAHAPRFRL